MALNDVGEEENHVATMPVALAHSRLHLLYVEELIDEREEARALTRHHIGNSRDVAHRHLALLHHARIAEDDGQRGAKLVGDVGEEREAHLV